MDYYARAVTLREQRKMPEVGYCMDRRALQHVAWYCDDSNVHSLICFVCAQIYTCCTGVSEPHCEYRGEPKDSWEHHWYPPPDKQVTEIRYYSVRQSLSNWHSMHPESFLEHFSLPRFREKYCTGSTHDITFPELVEASACWEWKRKVKLPHAQGEHLVLLCCPEDVKECGGKHQVGELCDKCMIPLCHSCFKQFPLCRQSKTPSIPMALGHDNFWAYTCALITKYKVRWIEISAVLPLWTHMVVYYVEGHDGACNEREVWSAGMAKFSPWAVLLICHALGADDQRIQCEAQQR